MMEKERRTVVYDSELQVEAYHLQGLMQRFPNHFHEHYVIGFIAAGRRHLTCNNVEYITKTGDLVLFHPRENHACEQVGEVPLDWRCLNIKPAVMQDMVKDISGTGELPVFKQNVVPGSELVPELRELHGLVMAGDKNLRKDELIYLFIARMISEFGAFRPENRMVPDRVLQEVCEYMEEHYMESVSLEQLSLIAGKNKYALLRSFTLERGITPYQYLSTIRINQAKDLIKKGTNLAETAVMTGFSDQSHLTRFFKNFIGVTPKVYQSMFISGDNGNREGREHG